MAVTNSKKSVAVILLSWNNAEDTIACIDSVRRLNYPNYEIVLVDNHSRQDQYQQLRAIERLVRLRQWRNRGFAGGCNAGIRWALRKGFDYIWLLNNDTIVDENSLSELVSVCESDASIGAAGAVMYYWKDRARVHIAGGMIDRTTGKGGVIGLDEIDNGQFDGIRDVDYACGGACLLRAQALRDVGLLDERFFMYYEDTDLGLRLRQRGWRVVSTAAAKVWHKAKATAGRKQFYYVQHGYLTFLYKNFPNYLSNEMRVYARRFLRPHLRKGEWRLALADFAVYWNFMTRLVFVRPKLRP